MKKIITPIKKNFIFYFLTCAIVLALNALLRGNDPSLLNWILAPTARWAGILGGLSFEPLPGRGYVNEPFRFLIAPSCSGVRFLQIVLLMLVFSRIHRVRANSQKLFWLSFCLAFSYVFTVFVNGLRIVLSIYIPYLLEHAALSLPLLTPEMLHTLIGSAVYFSSLLTLQPIMSALFSRLFEASDAGGNQGFHPALWYFAAVLGLPFVRNLAMGNMTDFASYAFPVALACSVILFLSHDFKKLL